LPVVVDVEVVPDDDDLARDARGDGLQELHQIPPRSLRPALSIDLAGAHVERCEERARAVAAVVELLPARAAGLRRLEPRPTLMCEEALLVDAEDGRVVGRRHVQLAHPFDLVVELRVLAVEPHPDAMRPDVSLSEDPPDLADGELLSGLGQEACLERGQGPDHPERRLVRLRTAACQADELRPHAQADPRRATASWRIAQT